jgi:hypothetical protein
MKDGLSIKFNHKAPKEIKTEGDIKAGERPDGYGGIMRVRGGKIIGHTKAHTEKLNEFRHAAGEASARKAKVSQELNAPAHAKPASPPSL